MLRSRRIHALLLLGLLAPWWLSGDRALAVGNPEDKVLFGPLGITPGERALVNIYVVGNPEDIGDPDITPWAFIVRVFDRRGNLVQEQKLQLARGAIGSVALAVQDEASATALPGLPIRLSRRTFRAEIVGFNPQPDPTGQWAATLEVVDRLTARTSLLLGGPDTVPARSN